MERVQAVAGEFCARYIVAYLAGFRGGCYQVCEEGEELLNLESGTVTVNCRRSTVSA